MGLVTDRDAHLPLNLQHLLEKLRALAVAPGVPAPVAADQARFEDLSSRHLLPERIDMLRDGVASGQDLEDVVESVLVAQLLKAIELPRGGSRPSTLCMCKSTSTVEWTCSLKVPLKSRSPILAAGIDVEHVAPDLSLRIVGPHHYRGSAEVVGNLVLWVTGDVSVGRILVPMWTGYRPRAAEGFIDRSALDRSIPGSIDTIDGRRRSDPAVFMELLPPLVIQDNVDPATR
jgi:hypothetical protein